ncbi:bile acid:sodium symporter family protein [Nocardioides mangrovi]|uniref:Bile acid:sodium symporter family protein n=1 Tax=Nocardioides mangrovi TaxID=2874580 RepID=A0ABS7U8W3_9ACTN|nr:bile acid:sodium symporter family protein [Nocardioides mangrovi]MBZ5737418.1 bile acid:sodium symporter family protein [Nocardioides mangrovi]
MDSALTTVALPLALGVIMFGLGLALTPDDFRRVLRAPRAVGVALVCQLLVLPLVCFGIVVAFDLPAELGIGMMLLAASPGGTAANLFSHLFRGDVALNISLTAINSVVSIVSLPIVTNLAIHYYDLGESVDLQARKVIEVFVVVLGPVLLGMLVRARSEDLAHRADRPVRIASAAFLSVIVLGIIAAEAGDAAGDIADVGVAVSVFCVISLLVGYAVPRVAGVTERQAVACSFEIGLHNATLAIYVAVEVLDVDRMAVPPAVYGLLMFFFAMAWGLVLTRRGSARRSAPSAAAPSRGD